jgi:MinD-like ATPase involved in chromosome partitioning or flagellar assembly
MADVNGRQQTTVVGLVAASGGVGRTGAVTNIAWILASADNRVLIVDWGSERPSVHDYLRPFLVADSSAAAFAGRPTEVPAGIPSPMVLREYAVPAGTHRIHVLATRDGADGTAPTGAITAEWARWTRTAGYDYVLIDGPTDVTAGGLSRVARSCDTVLLFFRPRRAAIELAGEVARDLTASADPCPRIIPVVSQYDDTNTARAKQVKENIQSAFAEPGPAGWPPHEPVELPYHPDYEYDEALAVLIDEPGEEGTLLAAYTRLAAGVTDGRVTALSLAMASTRDRYRHRLGLPAVQLAWRMAVTYAVADRPWADWVRQRLERAGVTVLVAPPGRELPADADVSSLVVVTSTSAGRDEKARVARLVERLGGPDDLDVVEIVVPEPGNGDPAPPAAQDHPAVPDTGGLVAAVDRIVVGDRLELDVGRRLLARFGLFDEPGEEGRAAIRFPGDPDTPAVHNLPPRREDFGGRDTVLERLRDGMTTPGAARRWACTGPGGGGKSELVREYAHRFGFHYDLIWWIPAHDLVAVRAALLGLAAVKQVTEPGDGVRVVLDALATGDWYTRSLLVYDNADLAELATSDLLPHGGAVDVLVTAREPAEGWDHVGVGPFTEEECAALVRARVPELAYATAARVGDALRHQPMAARLAAGLLADEVARLRARGMDSGQAAHRAATTFVGDLPGFDDDDDVLSGVLALLRPAMARTVNGRLALTVAEMCAFLSPEGVSARMLHSDAFLRTIARLGGEAAEPLLLDAGLFDQVLWTGATFGLFEVTWGQSGALLPRLVLQSELRRGEGAAAAKEAVLAALAAYAPGEAALWTAGTRAKFAELQRHIFVSGALTSTDSSVRRWLVNHLRFLFRTGDGTIWRFTSATATKVIERWLSVVGPDDELVLRMRGQLANLHRAVGEFARAEDIDDDVLATQRRVLGNSHLQTLISTRARAADLRSMGNYREAYAEDLEARDGFRDTLGDDHPHTRMASHNLAISAYLTGDVGTALDIQRDHRARQARLLGPNSVGAWKSAASVGVYLRELGHHGQAEKVLQEALQRIRDASHDPRNADLYWIEWQLATVRRRLGNRVLAKDSNTRTVENFRDLFGADNPNTRGCRLSLAADHHASDDDETAVALATACLAGYERVAADHPVTAVCRMNLSLYLRAGGRVAEALDAGLAAAEMLADWLDDTHPWTIIARANHAATLAIAGDLAAATALAGENDRLAGNLLADQHPYRVVSEQNLMRMRADATSGRWHELDIDVLPN